MLLKIRLLKHPNRELKSTIPLAYRAPKIGFHSQKTQYDVLYQYQSGCVTPVLYADSVLP